MLKLVRTFARLLLGVGVISLVAVSANAQCLIDRTDLPLSWDEHRPLVPVGINDKDGLAFVDTGTTMSIFYLDGVKRHGLRLRATDGAAVIGFGGTERLYAVVIKKLTLGAFTNKRLTLGATKSNWRGNKPVDFTLGADYLGAADIEYHFADNRLSFLHYDGDCSQTSLAYWDAVFFTTDLLVTDAKQPSLRTNVYLNGTRFVALLDTGASTSAVSLRAAKRLGYEPGSAVMPTVGTTVGTGRRSLETWEVQFEEFRIGGETIRKPSIDVFDMVYSNVGDEKFDMVLGADFFRAHRILVSLSQRKLYVTYLGGPVFGEKE